MKHGITANKRNKTEEYLLKKIGNKAMQLDLPPCLRFVLAHRFISFNSHTHTLWSLPITIHASELPSLRCHASCCSQVPRSGTTVRPRSHPCASACCSKSAHRARICSRLAASCCGPAAVAPDCCKQAAWYMARM